MAWRCWECHSLPESVSSLPRPGRSRNSPPALRLSGRCPGWRLHVATCPRHAHATGGQAGGTQSPAILLVTRPTAGVCPLPDLSTAGAQTDTRRTTGLRRVSQWEAKGSPASTVDESPLSPLRRDLRADGWADRPRRGSREQGEEDKPEAKVCMQHPKGGHAGRHLRCGETGCRCSVRSWDPNTGRLPRGPWEGREPTERGVPNPRPPCAPSIHSPSGGPRRRT